VLFGLLFASCTSHRAYLYQSIIALALAQQYVLGMVTSKEKAKVVTIVDDDELVRSALSGLMKSAGFPALAFASAEEFLNSGEQERTGCLIADIRMPGMSGLDLQSKLVRDHYRFPIIFITAQGDEKMRMQALRAGAVEFLSKPFDDGALLDCVRAALERDACGVIRGKRQHSAVR